MCYVAHWTLPWMIRGGGISQLGNVANNGINKTMFLKELSLWNHLASFANCVFNDTTTCETNQGLWSAMISPSMAKLYNPTSCWSITKPAHSENDVLQRYLGHLHQTHDSFLHTGTTRCCKITTEVFLNLHVQRVWWFFSPTTVPIEAMIKLESIMAKAVFAPWYLQHQLQQLHQDPFFLSRC